MWWRGEGLKQASIYLPSVYVTVTLGTSGRLTGTCVCSKYYKPTGLGWGSRSMCPVILSDPAGPSTHPSSNRMPSLVNGLWIVLLCVDVKIFSPFFVAYIFLNADVVVVGVPCLCVARSCLSLASFAMSTSICKRFSFDFSFRTCTCRAASRPLSDLTDSHIDNRMSRVRVDIATSLLIRF